MPAIPEVPGAVGGQGSLLVGQGRRDTCWPGEWSLKESLGVTVLPLLVALPAGKQGRPATFVKVAAPPICGQQPQGNTKSDSGVPGEPRTSCEYPGLLMRKPLKEAAIPHRRRQLLQ
ncbi:hypothetical protein NDU88_005206 [Pleurodeles waltl]|uniref:Uncharacterized protein n=1 Tax=Pleurodeles waltl TaxID=8319 RepID=A0AAV7PMZ7_PLEWA|nr:hypothetical protein NDU88_005206 [Pleurodeles waltl]